MDGSATSHGQCAQDISHAQEERIQGSQYQSVLCERRVEVNQR